MLVNVFTYGTLQVDTVMHAVTGRQFPSKPATLRGYRCQLVKKCVYPAIIQDPKTFTDGTLYFNVDEASLDALDEFENVIYDRLEVQVESENKLISAYAYVINVHYENRMSNHEWSLEEFKQKHLATYL